MTPVERELPLPPRNLAWDGVTLRFAGIIPGEPARGFAPYYHFTIVSGGAEVGHINFRVGDSQHVILYAGHIGYEVRPAFRGQHFALKACRALGPFVRTVYPSVIITADPDNEPSLRTIERLGAEFLGEVPVPRSDPHYAAGSRAKRRYEWRP